MAMGEENLIYDPETGKLYRIRELSCTADSGKRNGIWFGDRQYPFTHVIFRLMTGRWPAPGMKIDHKDGNPFNNKWDNLREATHTNNMHNVFHPPRTLENGETIVAGVTFRNNKYLVSISGVYLGSYTTAKEANEVAIRNRQAIHGEFARIE